MIKENNNGMYAGVSHNGNESFLNDDTQSIGADGTTDGTTCTNRDIIREHVINFYSDLFGSQNTCSDSDLHLVDEVSTQLDTMDAMLLLPAFLILMI